jgi:hypothetical protein
MREEKNCESNRNSKKLHESMAITKLGGDLVPMEVVKLICKFGNCKR